MSISDNRERKIDEAAEVIRHNPKRSKKKKIPPAPSAPHFDHPLVVTRA